MSIVTIRGHLGSRAPEIGKLVAEKLHTDYVDREIIAEVAKQLNWSEPGIEAKENPPGTLGGRILEALAQAYPAGMGYPGAYAYVPVWEIPLDDEGYLKGLESVIKELAASGSIVIRGRGSQFILKDYPALHVLVVAPIETRLKRTMENLKMDENDARKEIEHNDGSRGEFTKKYFNAELQDPVNYDLVVSTEFMTVEDTASIVVGALPFKERAKLEHS